MIRCVMTVENNATQRKMQLKRKGCFLLAEPIAPNEWILQDNLGSLPVAVPSIAFKPCNTKAST